jgi:hypothetical protein
MLLDRHQRAAVSQSTRITHRLSAIKRISFIVAIASALLGLAPAVALAAFGFEEVDVTFRDSDGSPATQAGSHPFALTTTLRMNTVEESGLESPDGDLRDLRVDYPAGLVADQTAVPRCTDASFEQIVDGKSACPLATVIGIAKVTASSSGPIPVGSEDFAVPAPVYNLQPSPGTVARIGFVAAGQPIDAEIGLSDAPPHNGFIAVTDLSQAVLFYSARVSVWGDPSDPAHDGERGPCAFLEGASCPVAFLPRPFLTLPRSCSGPLQAAFTAYSWQDPPQSDAASVLSHDNSEPPNPQGLTGCGILAFSPQIEAQPTTELADTPSGLDVSIDVDDEGLTNSNGLAQSEVRNLVLILPAGMTIDSQHAQGLVTCSQAQFAQESIDPEPGEGCPQASEIGTIEVETPLLAGGILEGQVFAGETVDSFDYPLTLYITNKDPELGILIRHIGEVEVEPGGKLTVWFEDIPQLPFAHLRLQLHENGSPLVTPPECGQFAIEAASSPWSKPSSLFVSTTTFEIGAGAGGGPCPSGETPPTDPGAPLLSNAAPPLVNPSNPAHRRHCPKGKRRIKQGGKSRCVRRRCLRARMRKRPVRRCVRPKNRDGARTASRGGGPAR